eukprot:gnl/TRDRNA2_/TRDRNA2_95229_c0_seq1.p1 gnl/TRDRNA2_/TRDRNA2_95229_c0~~gnl/TRDRNA2_/TRDRNA2_95229_c0_seq1.p1  ORF type:complete len:291 (+),score=31.75 gnl/TRDRNA2_/TRDRNA2_95229_c0_seq1:51-923(+)
MSFFLDVTIAAFLSFLLLDATSLAEHVGCDMNQDKPCGGSDEEEVSFLQVQAIRRHAAVSFQNEALFVSNIEGGKGPDELVPSMSFEIASTGHIFLLSESQISKHSQRVECPQTLTCPCASNTTDKHVPCNSTWPKNLECSVWDMPRPFSGLSNCDFWKLTNVTVPMEAAVCGHFTTMSECDRWDWEGKVVVAGVAPYGKYSCQCKQATAAPTPKPTPLHTPPPSRGPSPPPRSVTTTPAPPSSVTTTPAPGPAPGPAPTPTHAPTPQPHHHILYQAPYQLLQTRDEDTA